MRYPKMLGNEVLIKIGSSGVRNAVLFGVPYTDDRVRFPVASDVLGSSSSWSRMLLGVDPAFAIDVDDSNSAADKIRKLDFATGGFTPVTQAPVGAVRSAIWSPDGTKFLTGGTTDPFLEHWVLSTLTKDPTQLAVGALGSPGGVYGMAFSPDGTKLLVTFSAAPWFGIISYPALTLDTLGTVTGPPTGAARKAAWSPDGNWIAVGCSSGTQRMNIYDVATLTRLTFANIGQSFDGGGLSFNPTSQYCLGLPSGNTTTSLRLVRLADRTLIPVTLPSGYSWGTTSSIFWLTDKTALWFANSASNGVVMYTLNVVTLALTTTNISFSNATMYDLAFASGFVMRRLAGTVVDASNNPVARTVRAYHKESGILVAEGVSSAIDGSFEFHVFTSEVLTVVAVGAGAEVAKLYDSVTGAFLE